MFNFLLQRYDNYCTYANFFVSLRQIFVKNMKRTLFLLSAIAFVVSVSAQRIQSYEDYIALWRSLAELQQTEYGIPASISLAQGLLESAAGKSELAVKANNHFGVKCTGDWLGATYRHDDDEKNECFRKYANPADSWVDHAKFLQRSRYAPCFEIPVSNYIGWAHKLKECGYATDPLYPEKLIRIIETYQLADKAVADSIQKQAERDDDFFKPGQIEPQPKEKPLSARDERRLVWMHHTRKRCNGRTYIIAKPGDSYASLAFSLNVKERTLRMWNDALGRTLHEGEKVYCRGYKRRSVWMKEKQQMWVQPGESVWQVSQREGIREASVRKYNGFGDDVDFFRTRQVILLSKPKKEK